MPLFDLPDDLKQASIKFFKENSTNSLMGKREVHAILEKHKIKATDEQVQKSIDLISLTGDGITMEGFLNYMAFYHDMKDKDTEFLDAFRAFDIDGDGTISKDEVKYMCMMLDIKIDWRKLIAEADSNSDGKIDFDEFCQLMKRQ